MIYCICHDIFNITTLDQYNPFGTLLGFTSTNIFWGLYQIILIVWWCLTPLSTIVQLYQWRSVLLVEETGVPGENQRLVTSNWQTRSHNVLHLALIEVRTHSISGWLHRYSCQLSSDHGYDGPAGGVGLFWGVGLSKLCYWRSNVISSINRYVPLMSSSSSSGTVSTSAVVECKCAAPSEI